jgi:hypothetical protein
MRRRASANQNGTIRGIEWPKAVQLSTMTDRETCSENFVTICKTLHIDRNCQGCYSL